MSWSICSGDVAPIVTPWCIPPVDAGVAPAPITILFPQIDDLCARRRGEVLEPGGTHGRAAIRRSNGDRHGRRPRYGPRALAAPGLPGGEGGRRRLRRRARRIRSLE